MSLATMGLMAPPLNGRQNEKDPTFMGRESSNTSTLGKFVILEQTRYNINDGFIMLGCTLYSISKRTALYSTTLMELRDGR